MTTDYRALCAELTAELEFWSDLACKPSDLVFEEAEMLDLIKRARAALAQPEPVEPTDEEIMELMPQQMHEDLAAAARAMAWQAGTDNRNVTGMMRIILNRHAVDLARAVLARWGRPAIAPIPVSERLPGDQLCWWFEADEDGGYGSNWTLMRIRGSATGYTHWLPFHALPLPPTPENADG